MKPFRDDYTDFSFREVDSKTMKVWITNNLDIQFNLTPSFSDEFVSPQFGGGQLYGGTTITSTPLPAIRCVAIDVTMNEWRAISEWLSPFATGRLRFSFNNKTYYNAKVGSAISGVSWIRANTKSHLGDLYIIQFSISFVTVGDYAALGIVDIAELGRSTTFGKLIMDAEGNLLHDAEDYSITGTNTSYTDVSQYANNPYYFPFILAEDTVSQQIEKYLVYNTGAYDAYPNFKIDDIGAGFRIVVDGLTIYDYDLNYLRAILGAEVYGSTGLVMYNGRMLESARDANGFKLLRSNYNRGRCVIKSGKPELFMGRVVNDVDDKDDIGDELKIYLDLPAPKYDRYGENYSISLFTEVRDGEFGADIYPITLDGVEYPILLKDHLFVKEGDKNSTIEPDSEGRIVLTIRKWMGQADSVYKKSNTKVYVSICNYSTVLVQQPNTVGNGSSLKGQFIMQTRGAI